jgi:excisionase family DNA binding protein
MPENNSGSRIRCFPSLPLLAPPFTESLDKAQDALDLHLKRIFNENLSGFTYRSALHLWRFPVSKSEPVVKKRRRDGAGYSVPAAAEEIGISYKTLRDAIEMNQVRAIKFGRITRVPKAEVARLKETFA